jgi:hypothetical protein
MACNNATQIDLPISRPVESYLYGNTYSLGVRVPVALPKRDPEPPIVTLVSDLILFVGSPPRPCRSVNCWITERCSGE